MDEIITIGFDLAKNIFQVRAIDASGEVIVQRALKCAAFLPLVTKLLPCLIGMEAYAGAHHWRARTDQGRA